VKPPPAPICFPFCRSWNLLQGWLPSVPAQLFQVAPFPCDFTLLIMSFAQNESVRRWTENRPQFRIFFAVSQALHCRSGETLPAGLIAGFSPRHTAAM